MLVNLSASNITIGKADERRLLCSSQSARCHSARSSHDGATPRSVGVAGLVFASTEEN